jgi:hypothetical protein
VSEYAVEAATQKGKPARKHGDGQAPYNHACGRSAIADGDHKIYRPDYAAGGDGDNDQSVEPR